MHGVPLFHTFQIAVCIFESGGCYKTFGNFHPKGPAGSPLNLRLDSSLPSWVDTQTQWITTSIRVVEPRKPQALQHRPSAVVLGSAWTQNA